MRTVPRPLSNLATLSRGRVPGQLVIQWTDHCNARCPQCGMRVTERFERHRLPTDDVKRILDAAAERGIQAVSFTGGEPLLFLDELVELIEHAEAAGIPLIRTGTNGFFLRQPERAGWADRVDRVIEALAGTSLRNLWISVDSAVAARHEQMRGFPGLIAGIEAALPRFHAAGIWPSANLGINRNMGREVLRDGSTAAFYVDCRRAFEQFFEAAIGLGFTMINMCYPMSLDEDGAAGEGLDAVYAATSVDDVVRFAPRPKATLFRALLDTIPRYRSRIRIFSPRASLYALVRQYLGDRDWAQPCRGGVDFFFVDARDGATYPCGYRGGASLGRLWDLDLGALPREARCRACDWECFRDPSELFGPLLDLRERPVALMRRLRETPEYARLWLEDLRYYAACDLFDARVPPDHRRLAPFAAPAAALDDPRAVVH